MIDRLTYRLRIALASAFGISLAACTAGGPSATPAPTPETVVIADTVEVRTEPDRDPALELRAATLRLQLFERTAQVENLQRQLEAARQEIVRAMARLQTFASRAEAASAMAEAEAEIALEATAGDGGDVVPEVAQAQRLLELSAAEFSIENYGGALYLASQARRAARTGNVRLSEEQRDLQAGEVLFALPLSLETTGRSNVRAGPGLGFPVLFTLDAATPVVGHSHAEQWVRITDAQRRDGWIFHDLVTTSRDGAR